eukprot:scaffold329466_cov36-Prasinocladus_malaysianus.AAC.1
MKRPHGNAYSPRRVRVRIYALASRQQQQQGARTTVATAYWVRYGGKLLKQHQKNAKVIQQF